MKTTTKALITVFTTLSIVACSGSKKNVKPDDASTDANNSSLEGSGVGRADRYGQEAVLSNGDGATYGNSPELERPRETTIHFAFDSSILDESALRIIAAHAEYIRSNPSSRVRLGGHTDERGTREYNIALGERRAESVRRAMLLRGVPRAQLNVVSYGEENPVAYGSSEASWAKNRRVEFSYLR